MRNVARTRWTVGLAVVATTLIFFLMDLAPARAGEPNPATYWKVDDIRPGMKGTGQTVMVGTKLEEFGAEVLGVMRGVSPGAIWCSAA